MSNPLYSSLPNKAIDRNSELANQFWDLNCKTFHQACEHVWRIPYGRTSKSSDWNLVLTENIGTCSTKHALLKSLADELGLEIELILGIYPMKESNTPGVGPVLSASKLDCVPEAHCYLSYGGNSVDLTKFGRDPKQPISEFFHEQKIEPIDIGEVKRSIHKQFIAEHYGEKEIETIWAVREKCINAICT